MGSQSDWETMQHCTQTLDQLGVSYEKRVISAHRTPHLAFEWCGSAEARGLKVIIAAAGGAAYATTVDSSLLLLNSGGTASNVTIRGLDLKVNQTSCLTGIAASGTYEIGRAHV